MAIRELAGQIVGQAPPAATIAQVQSTVTSGYATAPTAEQTFPLAGLTTQIATCGKTTLTLRQRYEPCDVVLLGLIRLYGATRDPSFAMAASGLWGFVLRDKVVNAGDSFREYVESQVKYQFHTELGVKPVSITGRVTDEAGAAVPGVSVGAACAWFSSTGGNTRADGTYSIDNLWPAPYLMQVGNSIGYPQVLYSSGAPGGWTVDYAMQTPVVVDGVPVAGIDIVLPTGTRISGSVADSSGAPFSGVRVRASSIGSTAQSETIVAADGTFSLGVIPGSYTLLFMLSGGEAFFLTTGGVAHNTPGNTPKTLKIGTSPVEGVNVQLPVSR